MNEVKMKAMVEEFVKNQNVTENMFPEDVSTWTIENVYGSIEETLSFYDLHKVKDSPIHYETRDYMEEEGLKTIEQVHFISRVKMKMKEDSLNYFFDTYHEFHTLLRRKVAFIIVPDLKDPKGLDQFTEELVGFSSNGFYFQRYNVDQTVLFLSERVEEDDTLIEYMDNYSKKDTLKSIKAVNPHGDLELVEFVHYNQSK